MQEGFRLSASGHVCRLVIAMACLGLGALWAPAPALAQAQAAGRSDAAPPPAAAPAPPARGEGWDRVDRKAWPAESAKSRPDLLGAWGDSQTDVTERAHRTRAVARELGIEDFDAAARAVLLGRGPGSAVERARAAVELAPDLPLARAALASALWAAGDAIGAAREAAQAVLSLDRQLEASLWWRANALYLLALGVFLGALLHLGLAAAVVARPAAHDLGDLLGGGLPHFAQAALLAALVLAAPALGEGWLGLGLGLFAVAMLRGRGRGRFAALLAALLLLLALHPLLETAARSFAALGADPVVDAVDDVEHGLSSRAERGRLERVAASDPLAAEALAAQARRDGDLAGADARYRALLVQPSPDGHLENDAANVRLALGDLDGATALFERATKIRPDALYYFNLAHAYARSIRLDRHGEVLGKAQALDDDLVAELTELTSVRGGGLTYDAPVSLASLRERLLERAEAAPLAVSLRGPLAPGGLGRAPLAALVFAATAAGALALGRLWRASGRCARCDGRTCPRCDRTASNARLCNGCARLFHRPETTDPSMRMARLTDLRIRQRRRQWVERALGALLPGAAGALAGRPLLGLVGALAAGGLAALLGVGTRLAPDPLAAGPAGRWALDLVVLSLCILHGVTTLLAWKLREEA